MGKTGTRLPGFCLNRIRPHVRVRSPPIQSKPPDDVNSPSKNNDQKATQNPGGEEEVKKLDEAAKAKPLPIIIGRKIMIVVDSSIEAKGALQWALSHTVQSHDLVVLLHVTKPSKHGMCEDSSKERAPRAYELVNSMKKMCESKRPEVQIETVVVEGKEKGPTIVDEAKRQEVALLVLGQKKQSMTWRLIMMWANNRVAGGRGGGGGGGVVEYCIQNADCMALAVRRKGKKHGGYLITTKRQKDFWLLA